MRTGGGGLTSEAGFVDFYRAEFVAAVRFAYLLTGSRELAEDVAQETLLALEPKLTTVQNPRAYLRAAIVNRVAGLRRRDLRRERRLDGLYSEQHVDPPAREVVDVLARLPHRERTALVLRYWLDLPNADVADTMRRPEGTVKSLISRGLERMRAELEES